MEPTLLKPEELRGELGRELGRDRRTQLADLLEKYRAASV
jgi:hypothetical protein